MKHYLNNNNNNKRSETSIKEQNLDERNGRSWPIWQNPISTENTKISWAWWWVPVIPATQKSGAGELLEPTGRGCSELRQHYSILAWATEQDSISKKKN